MTVQEIIAELGEPTQTNLLRVDFSKLGIILYPGDGTIVLIPPFAGRTRAGIGMGSSRDDVIQAYGAPEGVNPTTKTNFVILSYESLGLSFQLHDDKVDWIKETSQPGE